MTTRLTSKGGNDIANNTREGYIEIFNMADITPATATTTLFATIKHSSAGVPACNSGVINGAILTTNWTTEAQVLAAGMNTPTTGLFGDWSIINVPQTTTYSGQMVAIRALDGAGPPNDARGNYVLFPQSASAYVGNINLVTADPLMRTNTFTTMTSAGVGGGATTGPLAAAFFDMPDMSTPYFPAVLGNPLAQAANLTASLAVKSVMNEYMTDSIITGKTDWTFSMPTRRYSVAMDYSPSTSRRLFTAGYERHTPGLVLGRQHRDQPAEQPADLRCRRCAGVLRS